MPEAADLFRAIDAGDAVAIEGIVADAPALAAAVGSDGVSAVLKACYAWRFEIAARLGSAKADLGGLDLLEAAALGRVDDIQAIVGRDPEAIRAWSADGFTALHYAAYFGGAAATRTLLDLGAPIDALTRNPMAVLPSHSAGAGRHAEVVLLLVDAGTPVDATSHGGFTVLHEAAQNGDEALVDALLARGAAAGRRTDDGRSAADLAAAAGHAALADRLKEAER